MCSYFRHISLCFYSNSEWESSLDAEFNFASNEYPHCIPFMDPTTPKTRNTKKRDDDVLPKNKKSLKKTWWWHHHHMFSGISCFGGRYVHQKYVVWVLVGCGIKLHIQRALPLRIWVKIQGDMSKIRTQKVVFFILPPKLITIILLFSLGGPF